MALQNGIYQCDDGGLYYLIRQQSQVMWYGEKADLHFSHIFMGNMSGNHIRGTWLDLPKGLTQNTGQLHLSLKDIGFEKVHASYPTGGTHWTLTNPAQVSTNMIASSLPQSTRWHIPSSVDETKSTEIELTGIWIDTFGNPCYLRQSGTTVAWMYQIINLTNQKLPILYIFWGMIKDKTITGYLAKLHPAKKEYSLNEYSYQYVSDHTLIPFQSHSQPQLRFPLHRILSQNWTFDLSPTITTSQSLHTIRSQSYKCILLVSFFSTQPKYPIRSPFDTYLRWTHYIRLFTLKSTPDNELLSDQTINHVELFSSLPGASPFWNADVLKIHIGIALHAWLVPQDIIPDLNKRIKQYTQYLDQKGKEIPFKHGARYPLVDKNMLYLGLLDEAIQVTSQKEDQFFTGMGLNIYAWKDLSYASPPPLFHLSLVEGPRKPSAPVLEISCKLTPQRD